MSGQIHFWLANCVLAFLFFILTTIAQRKVDVRLSDLVVHESAAEDHRKKKVSTNLNCAHNLNGKDWMI